MKNVTSFLANVWVKQFYIIHAGFLFFIFYFFFGMVNGGQLIAYHKSLISSTLSSPFFMGVVMLAWLLYNVKCILFFRKIIKADNGGYLYALKALSNSRQWWIYLLTAVLVYLPVLSYSCGIVYMAIRQSLIVQAVAVIAYQLLMAALNAWVVFYTINKNNHVAGIEKIAATIESAFSIKLSYPWFLTGFIFDDKKIAFLTVKVFSIALLSVSFVINGDHFDEDLFGIFYLLIFTGHAILVFYSVGFIETALPCSRNLPIAWYRVAAMYFFTYSILLLPEFAFMLVNNHGNLTFADITVLYFTTTATLFLCTAYLYGNGLNMESYQFLVL